jgi:peptidyl-prolyl cis-trans isomerase B (cyclophilin B)
VAKRPQPKGLSSRTFLVDEIAMTATLSQSFSAPDARREHGSPTRTALALGLLMLLCVACNRVEIGADSAPESQTGPATNADRRDEASPDFTWPAEAEHPRLMVTIDDGSTHGTIEIELMPELAPLTVARFMDLAKNGYYDGTTFHRVIPGFMIQGGNPNSRDRDPGNDGYGDPELYMEDEFGSAPFERGVVGMGNEGRRDSTSGQFFIMHRDQRDLDGRYTAIGRVVSGIEIVDAVAQVATDKTARWGAKDRPLENVVMTRVTIAAPSPVSTASPGAMSDAMHDNALDSTPDTISAPIPEGMPSQNSVD